MKLRKGFFKEEAPEPPKKKSKSKVYDCELCKLYQKCKSPKMPVSGEGQLKVLLLGETPGYNEDEKGIQFIGDSGQLLRKHLKDFSVNLDVDFWKKNVVACRCSDASGANRNPTKTELKCCVPLWRQDIENLKPEFIFLMGGSAVEAFFGNYSKGVSDNLSIGRWRSLCIPDPVTKTWVIPLYHPAFVLRNPDAEHVFRRDLVFALNQLERQPPEFKDWTKYVYQLTQFDNVVHLLQMVLKDVNLISFDYETSGLRPFKSGHKIWTISLGFSSVGTPAGYSFPFSYPGHWTPKQFSVIKNLWCQILENPRIKKVEQNIQMEEIWSRVILGTPVQGQTWDTMVCSHVLDQRAKFTSLDFQVFINWGYEYGENIAPFKKAVEGTEFNTMHQAPLDELLQYSALDALFTLMLSLIQKDKLKKDPHLRKGYNLFHEGVMTFCDSEEDGLSVDTDYYVETAEAVEKEINEIEQELLCGEEAHKFTQKTGMTLDLDSIDHLKTLFFEIMKLPVVKWTEKGNESVDKDVLEMIDSNFARKLVDSRKLKKLKSTYLDNFIWFDVDGKVHVNHSLHLVTSYRSSSGNTSPNLQNIIKRDERGNKLIRTGIIPSKGNKLMEVDYSANEVKGIACYSKDKQLIEDILNGFDLHAYWGEQLGLINAFDKPDEKKLHRFDAKNSFVFPLFYGSYFKSISKDLIGRGYEHCDEEYVKLIEDDFWARYSGVKRWQEGLLRFYKEHGYIEMFTGFRVGGFLTRNQVANIIIQGTCFHWLLWSMNELNSIMKEEEWRSRGITMPVEIHDAILFDVNPSEEEMVINTVQRVMTEELPKAYPQIIVPLAVDIDITEIDQPWNTKKGIKL